MLKRKPILYRIEGNGATYWIDLDGRPKHVKISDDGLDLMPGICIHRFNLEGYKERHGNLADGQYIPVKMIGYWYSDMEGQSHYQKATELE